MLAVYTLTKLNVEAKDVRYEAQLSNDQNLWKEKGQERLPDEEGEVSGLLGGHDADASLEDVRGMNL